MPRKAQDTGRGSARRTPAGSPIVSNPKGGQPPGTLSTPFFGKQGDEQRDPTPGEKEALAKVQRELLRG
jgi:hypothetical protein